jgi:hypothetical protein
MPMALSICLNKIGGFLANGIRSGLEMSTWDQRNDARISNSISQDEPAFRRSGEAYTSNSLSHKPSASHQQPLPSFSAA